MGKKMILVPIDSKNPINKHTIKEKHKANLFSIMPYKQAWTNAITFKLALFVHDKFKALLPTPVDSKV